MGVLAYIDKIGRTSGLVVRWLGLVLSFVVIWEVICRYVFNSPTIWAFDTAMILTSTLYLMGGAFVLHEGKHIRVDVLYNMFPQKVKTIVDLVFYVVFFFPFTYVMTVYGYKAAKWSWVAREISNTSQWGEPIYYWKAMVPLAFFLMFLQGIAEFVRTVYALIHPAKEITK